MAASGQRFVGWDEKFVSKERGKRVVHYFLKEKSGESVLAVVGTESTVGYMSYRVAQELLRASGSNYWVYAECRWRSRREVVDWLGWMRAPYASGHRFVEWREEFVSNERGKKVVHYFLTEKSGESVLAVVGTELSVGCMSYMIAEEFRRVSGSNCVWYNVKSRREVVNWLLSMLSTQHLLQGQCATLVDRTPINIEVGSKTLKIEDNSEPCSSGSASSLLGWEYLTMLNFPKQCPTFPSKYRSPTSKKRSGEVSNVWDHSSKDYAYDNNECEKYPDMVCDKKQKVLSCLQTGNDGERNILAMAFDKERCQRAVARFVVKDKHAFDVVEGEGFKELVQELQPKFVVPSRMTVMRDIYKLFCDESIKLKKVLTKAGQRVCLTTDCWTSSTQMTYMCLTAHYIDSDWHLQKKIINFCQISNHEGGTIGKVIETCLLGWGIEKVLTMTVDNASANDIAVGFVKMRVNAWNGSVLDGKFMHLRCGAHIVNLIVNEGLKDMHDSIVAIRNCVRYIRSSPARLEVFKTCAEKEKIDYKGWLVLDVPTRWNSTFMMLDVALKFEKAFVRYEEEDDRFLRYFEETENGKKRVGPPTSNDWEHASIFVKVLSTFYDVSLKFSDTLHVTSNNFYHEICDIHGQLTDMAASSDRLLSTVAASMNKKYDKYWGNPNTINPLLFLAVVLDPRYKMRYLKYCFETIYDAETVIKIVAKVEKILCRLYNTYNDEGDRGGDKVTKNEALPKGEVKGIQRGRLLKNYLQQQMQVPEKMNDIDRYLVEEPLNPMIPSFDILLWWKDNSSRYKILSMIAKDVLAIPVFSVSSESAFSTSGRILDSFRSSLSSKMVETLVCTQDWLKGSHEGIQTREYLDEIQSYEFLEEENMNELNVKTTEAEKTKTVIVD